MKWQCVMFDAVNERTVAFEADSSEDAVRGAWRETLQAHCDDPSQMDVESLYLTLPEDGDLQIRASVQVPCPDAHLFVVVDQDRMTVPVGILRKVADVPMPKVADKNVVIRPINSDAEMTRVLAESLQPHLQELPPEVVWLAAIMAVGEPPIAHRTRMMQVELALYDAFIQENNLKEAWEEFLKRGV